MKDAWLPLTEYSTKYKVSISTLRRRIKGESIQFHFSDGKYFILDSPIGAHEREIALEPSPSQQAISELMGLEKTAIAKSDDMAKTVNHLIEELKKAYSLILHEKEEQILQLREEITDLRTLVRALESENNRLMA